MYAKEVGQFLKGKRKTLGITTSELGKLTDLSQPYISGIENGNKGQKANVYAIIKIIFGLAPNNLTRNHLLMEYMKVDKDLQTIDLKILNSLISSEVYTE